MIVWDLLDLDNPVYLGFYSGPTSAIDHNVFVKGDKIFVANYAAGMRVLQIDPTDPLNLKEIASVDTFMSDNDTDFDGCWGCFPFFPSGVVIANDRQNGLFVVRLTELEFDFPMGRPDFIDPSGQVEFQVSVSGFTGTPATGTGTLHVDMGSGFVEFPMTEVSTDLYDVVFPATDSGTSINYFVSATSANGIQECFPRDAPETFFTATSADAILKPFADNFETDQGWSVSGDAASGQWERGVPAGNGSLGDPVVDADGSGQCYLTENAPGNADVDDGSTILTSPVIDAVGSGNATSAFLSYSRWYSNDVGNAPASDTFVVEISNDNGQSWTEVETVGPAGNEVSGGWFHKMFDIADFVAPTDQMRVRFTASDLGAGSVVEAAVDGVEMILIVSFLLGDINLDGVVDFLDITPFITTLTSSSFQAEADINKDGIVDFLDIQGFIGILAFNG